MQRRRFLAVFGAGALGTAGALAGRAMGVSPGAADRGRPLELPGSGVHRIVWSVETADPVAALTFDDGPEPELTAKILDILDDFDAHATFMAMGYNAVRYPQLVQEIVAAGHEMGNHTWSHRNLRDESPAATFREVERGARAIQSVTGQETQVFRPPRGEFTADVVRSAAGLRHDLVLWSVERREPADLAPPRLADALAARTSAGDIVLLHDGYGRGTFAPDEDWAERLYRRRAQEIAALPRFLAEVREKGLRVETVSNLIGREQRTERAAPSPREEGDGR